MINIATNRAIDNKSLKIEKEFTWMVPIMSKYI